MSDSSLEQRLGAGLEMLSAEIGLTVDADAQARLLEFLKLLIKWNKTYNLTAVRDPELMVSHHLLDSLSVHPHLAGTSLADIGTGAGLPGMPLAIVNPDRQFLLIDSNSKKTRFITHAVARLGLTNVTVWHGRSEHYEAGAGFDTVMCRALASIPKLIEIGGHLLSRGGRLVAQKGHVPKDELGELPDQWLATTVAVDVPFLEDKTRHIIVLQQKPDPL